MGRAEDAPGAERRAKHLSFESGLAAMSSPFDKFDPEKRVFWRLRIVAQTLGEPLGRSEEEWEQAALYGYQWLRQQPIPEEAWSAALSGAKFDSQDELLFRDWFYKAAELVRDVVREPGPLVLPPQRIFPPPEAMTGEPVGDPDFLAAVERAKDRVLPKHYELVIRVISRRQRGETIEAIVRDYRMVPEELWATYKQVLQVLQSAFTYA